LKEGQSVGSVTVWVKNEGEEAYEPHLYGDVIQIERKITETSSSYKIKSATGLLF
jgi:hypothetical protein